MEYQAAFNAGSDARLDGWPLSANPYAASAGGNSPRAGWRDGWHNVQYTWGIGARWPHRSLPAVSSLSG